MRMLRLVSGVVGGLWLAQAGAADSFVVRDIEIEGLQRVALGAALLHVPVRVGESLDAGKIQKLIRSLSGSGHFESVQVFRDGDTLLIEVRERPTIASVVFSGNKDIPDDKLQETLTSNNIREGDPLDRSSLAGLEKAMEEFYHGVGKYNAKVQAIVTPLPRNRVDLKFVFTEGESAAIRQINIVGNTIFSDELLQQNFELKSDVPWWQFLSSDRYEKQKLQGDIETLTTYYRDRGYVRFAVDSTQVSLAPNKEQVYVTLNVTEGDLYKVSTIRLAGNLIDKGEQLERLITVKAGQTYSAADVTQTEELISRFLGRFGYAYPKVSTMPEIDDERKEVALTVYVEPGNRIYVRRINFFGNHVTKDEVLRREMRQMEGSWLSEQQLETSKIRLNRLGFFETADYKVNRLGDAPDLVDVDVSVKEQQTGQFNAGVGFGTSSGLSFQLGVSQNNFLGSGDSVSLQGSRNVYQKTVDLSYRDPYFTVDGVSLGGRVFYSEFDANNANLVSYNNSSYGLSVPFGFPINETDRINTGFGYTHNSLSQLEPYDQILKFYYLYGSDQNPNESLEFDSFSLNLGWERNRLNKGIFATEGYYHNVSGEITVPVGDDLQYFRTEYEGRVYFPLNRSHSFSLMFKGNLGYGNGYGSLDGNDHIMPFWKYFRAGGVESIRGFSSNTIGPRAILRDHRELPGPGGGITLPNDEDMVSVSSNSLGGNAMASATVELFVPTPFLDESYNNSVRTSLFFDIGNVWDTEFNYDAYTVLSADELAKIDDYSVPGRIRYSAGLSVQWYSPMGPMIFSLAKPLKKYEYDESEVFGFTVGRTF
ncbi:MAG: outer membrane protein assembly factor BamA [Gammaproteobacteria bacterium]|nr:outer membrane protein assembly factor BamA [Gammaproteobacteria bacterium]